MGRAESVRGYTTELWICLNLIQFLIGVKSTNDANSRSEIRYIDNFKKALIGWVRTIRVMTFKEFINF